MGRLTPGGALRIAYPGLPSFHPAGVGQLDFVGGETACRLFELGARWQRQLRSTRPSSKSCRQIAGV